MERVAAGFCRYREKRTDDSQPRCVPRIPVDAQPLQILDKMKPARQLRQLVIAHAERLELHECRQGERQDGQSDIISDEDFERGELVEPSWELAAPERVMGDVEFFEMLACANRGWEDGHVAV